MGEDRRRDALLQIGLAIGSAVEIDTLLDLVMGHVTQLLSAERSTLYTVERELAQATDAAQLLDAALSRAIDLAAAEAGAALLVDEERSELYFKKAVGGAGEALLSTRVPISAGIAGAVAQDGIPRLVHDAEHESAVAREVAQRYGYRSRSLCAAPIQADG